MLTISFIHHSLDDYWKHTPVQVKVQLIILPLGEVNLERRQGELLANASLVVDSLRLQRRVLTAVPEGSKAAT